MQICFFVQNVGKVGALIFLISFAIYVVYPPNSVSTTVLFLLHAIAAVCTMHGVFNKERWFLLPYIVLGIYDN